MKRCGALALFIIACLLAVGCGERDKESSEASPNAVRVTGGTAVLTFAPNALREMERSGIDVSRLQPARRQAGRRHLAIAFPIVGGSFDRRLHTAVLQLAGGLVFFSTATETLVRAFKVNSLRELMTGTVGTADQPVFNLEGGTFQPITLGSQRGIRGRFQAELHGAMSRDLQDAFDGRAFGPGMKIGQLDVQAYAPMR